MNCTNCTKISFFVEICKQAKKKLSTLINGKKVEKWGFPQSYPHYPQKKISKMWITLLKKRTGVLLINDKNQILSKNFYEKT